MSVSFGSFAHSKERLNKSGEFWFFCSSKRTYKTYPLTLDRRLFPVLNKQSSQHHRKSGHRTLKLNRNINPVILKRDEYNGKRSSRKSGIYSLVVLIVYNLSVSYSLQLISPLACKCFQNG